MINVLHIRSSNGFYGAERVITTLLPNTERLNIAVELVVIEDYLSNNMDLHDVATKMNITTTLLSCNKKVDFKSIRKLIRYIKKQNVDIIHTHDAKSDIYGWIAAKVLHVPIVNTLHGWTTHTTKMRIYEKLDKMIQRSFNRTVLVAPVSEINNNKNYLEKCTYIPNGVDINIFNESKSGFGKAYWSIKQEQFTFGIFARFTKEKGHKNLIEAFIKAFEPEDNVCLLMIGSGPEYSNIQRLIDHYNLYKNIKLFPACDQIDKAMHDIDCYVSPSLTEGMPMVILEAMASGVPIIATEVGAITELLGGGAGLTVPPNDENALSSALRNTYEIPSKLQSMKQKALTRAESEYSSEIQAKRYVDIYQKLCTHN